MTISLIVAEIRLTDDSLVYNVTMTDEHAGTITMHAVTENDAMLLCGKLCDAIGDHTTEVMTVTRWERL